MSGLFIFLKITASVGHTTWHFQDIAKTKPKAPQHHQTAEKTDGRWTTFGQKGSINQAAVTISWKVTNRITYRVAIRLLLFNLFSKTDECLLIASFGSWILRWRRKPHLWLEPLSSQAEIVQSERATNDINLWTCETTGCWLLLAAATSALHSSASL